MIGINKQISGSKSGFSASVTVAALLAFAVINFACNREEFRYVDSLLNQNVCALRFLLSPESNEKVVLLGSSIMETPYGIFAKGHGYYDSKAKPMEKWFTRNAGENIGVANLSMEAATISDQYILVSKYLLARSPMPVLVLGVAPRDFIDYRFREPSKTYVYCTMVNLSDTDIWPHYVKTLEQSLKFIFDQLSVLYRFRKIINESICAKIRELPKMFWQADNVDRHPAAVQPNTLVTNKQADSADIVKARFRASLEEYKLIYGNAENDTLYCSQMNFLKHLLALCHKQKASLLLVNMPLSAANRDLMPTGFYKKFGGELKDLTDLNKTAYVDAANSGDFKDDQDYWNGAHLNQAGGEKLDNLICPLIKRMLSARSMAK